MAAPLGASNALPKCNAWISYGGEFWSLKAKPTTVLWSPPSSGLIKKKIPVLLCAWSFSCQWWTISLNQNHACWSSLEVVNVVLFHSLWMDSSACQSSKWTIFSKDMNGIPLFLDSPFLYGRAIINLPKDECSPPF